MGVEDPVRRHIERMYDDRPGYEWERLERHRTEFAVTLRALEEHLPRPPARVLDCGGGPGRYAIELAGRGYDVVLFDLASGCLDLAHKKAAEASVALAGYEQGTATDLTRFPDEAFDAVLLMGPLYHLLEVDDRRQALAEAHRVLKPGGGLFAAFIGRYAPLRWAAANDPSYPLRYRESAERILDTGKAPPRGISEHEFVAYFARAEEVGPLCRQAGFEIAAVLGVEGLVSMIEEGVNALSGEEWAYWVELNRRVAADPSLHGGAEHLLVVGVKPRWRAILRRIARELNSTGVSFKVVGGASAALQGVPLRVKDLDIELDREGAYRFQALFADRAVKPVGLSEGDHYRSHFGQFDLDGVTVEVMGDLHRRAGEGWVPSTTVTETTVQVGGEEIRVSRLEEETLAYVRRDRLDRAALCLPYCHRGRLLALLRGEQQTNVL